MLKSATCEAAPPAAGTPGVRIERGVDIQASAQVIWALISEVDRWPRWNPLYAEASGPMRLGATLHLAVVLPGLKPQKVRAVILALRPDAQLQYGTVSLGGLLRGARYVDIQPSASGGCRVLNGEIMGGLLARPMARVLGRRVERGFQLMNAALKAQAEAQTRRGQVSAPRGGT